MIEEDEQRVLPAMRATDEEKFYIEWGRETLKNNLTFANEILRQLVTLNATLLGGSIAFLSDNVIDATLKTVIICFFLLSLIVSFVGIMPYESSVDLRIPAEIRQNRQLALKWKRRYLWTAGGLLALGFGVATVALLSANS